MGLLAGGFTVVAAPFALSAAGFTTGGIAAGSIASQLMSWAAIAQGGGVAAASAGGWIAALQSAGAAGIGFFSNLVLGVGAGTAGSVLTHTFSENPGSSDGLCEVQLFISIYTRNCVINKLTNYLISLEIFDRLLK